MSQTKYKFQTCVINIVKKCLFDSKVEHYNLFKVSRNYFSAMCDPNILKPPDCVKGMTVLNSELFRKNIKVPVLNIQNLKVSNVLPTVKQYLLKVIHLKPIIKNDNETLIYLNPALVQNWSNLPLGLQNSLESLNLTKDNLFLKDITLNYDNYSTDDIFRAILPSDKEGMSSFTKVGHIVHVNLREHLLPYKNIIGKVLFDKTSDCKTVVNKINMIDNTYRNFKMEILEGVDDTLVTLKENLCTFQFDFSTVYWNSRLCTEHDRIIKMLNPNDVLFDVFAGVGPFSVPVAKKKCIVYANDLNPESFKWLNHNFKLNKIDTKYFTTYNKDGRDFIKNEIKQYLPQYLGSHNVYITMNLPAMAVEFLDAFVNLFEENELPDCFTPVKVYVYCFAKGEDYNTIAKNLVINNLGYDAITDLFKVRTVSSLKEMMRVVIELDRNILLGKIPTNKRKSEDEEHINKKCNYGQKDEECI